MLIKPGTKLRWRKSDRGGWEWSDDGGVNWHLTFRGKEEIMEMHKTVIEVPDDTDIPDATASEEADREVFGETLDEEIPEDLWEMLSGIG